MGHYSEYMDRQLSFSALSAERKNLLSNISRLRGGRDILVYAADLDKGNAPIQINYDDILAIKDQLANLNGSEVDLILETPGGSGEVAEDIVRLIHGKYQEVGIIIPGWAKSAGTIMAMSATEILMEPTSALGPIDAQITWQGKHFSADALIEGLEKIKEETVKTGILNKAYIPILQGISPGEIQSAENALKFSKVLVTDWLANYKFKNWLVHSSTGQPVTTEDRKNRANEIAEILCNHRQWLTHGRSIMVDDLKKMRLLVTDYSSNPALSDAIRRYYTLLRMTFSTNIYKVYETPTSQIYRFSVVGQPGPPPQVLASKPDVAFMEIECVRCKFKFSIQANLGKSQPLKEGHFPFPINNKLQCPSCGQELDLSLPRRQIESQSRKTIVP